MGFIELHNLYSLTAFNDEFELDNQIDVLTYRQVSNIVRFVLKQFRKELGTKDLW